MTTASSFKGRRNQHILASQDSVLYIAWHAVSNYLLSHTGSELGFKPTTLVVAGEYVTNYTIKLPLYDIEKDLLENPVSNNYCENLPHIYWMNQCQKPERWWFYPIQQPRSYRDRPTAFVTCGSRSPHRDDSQ